MLNVTRQWHSLALFEDVHSPITSFVSTTHKVILVASRYDYHDRSPMSQIRPVRPRFPATAGWRVKDTDKITEFVA